MFFSSLIQPTTKGEPVKTAMIVRKGNLQYERKVHVYVGDHLRWDHVYYIDPQEEIWMATGIRPDRYQCILSLADGLQFAELEVEILHRKWFGDRREMHRSRNTYSPLYALFGLALGLGEWPRIVASLQQYVVSTSRFAVLDNTARFIHTRNAWYEPIRLCLP
jgi:hypothetical protein